MADNFPIRLTGNDTRTKPENLALGNTSPAAAEKGEAFSNCGFRLAYASMEGFQFSRGGKHFLPPSHARFFDRNANGPGARRAVLGFRLARDEEGT